MATEAQPSIYSEFNHIVYGWLSVELLGESSPKKEAGPPSSVILARLDEWLLRKVMRQAFEGLLFNADTAYWDAQLVGILVEHHALLGVDDREELQDAFRRLLLEPAIRAYLEVHAHNEVLWLNKERLERMVNSLGLAGFVCAEKKKGTSKAVRSEVDSNVKRILDAAEKAGYQVDRFVQLLA